MGDSLILYRTLMTLLCQHLRLGKGHSWGQLKTLAWCLVGLLLVGKVSVPPWASQIVSNAPQQASRERRLYRWLSNTKVVPVRLYGPLVCEALRRWGGERLYLALDTTTLWNRFTVSSLSVIYRGRAIPLAWRVIRSQSTSVSFQVYQSGLLWAAKLLPVGTKIVLLGDRGFADIALMGQARDLGWSFRLRLKSTMLALTFWGTADCALQLCRTLDGHWLRGLSYLRIGWNFVRRCLAVRLPLPTWLHLDSAEDPEPAYPSLRQARQPGLTFRVCFNP